MSTRRVAISGAPAMGLTNRFGENFTYRDTPEKEFGIAPGNFIVHGGRQRAGKFANWLLRNPMKLK
jgi:hypothetical protein